MKEDEIRPPDLFNRYLELARRDTQAILEKSARFTEVDCPACGAARKEPAFEKLGFRYVLCAECRTLYNSPRPTAALLSEFYRNGESVSFWSTDFFKSTAEARREKMFRPRAELIGELCERRGIHGEAVIADIGAGYGIFLEEIARLGRFNDIVGIEPGPELAQVCRDRGFRVVQKAVEDVQPSECQADVATAFEVLEHVFEPLDFLRGARRLLKPGGTLLLTTLTVDGFDIQLLWEKSKSVFPPHHLNLLSINGIERLFARAGFAVSDLQTPGKLDVDIVANAAKEDPTLRLPRFISMLLARRDSEIREEFQSFLAGHRLSSHLRVLATAV